MPVITIVENYIFALLRHAEGEELEDGTLVATIPELPGIIAYGEDAHECSRELYRLIEETVRIWLRAGHALPIIEGINLNSNAERILASYHTPSSAAPLQGDFYQDESELEAGFGSRRGTA